MHHWGKVAETVKLFRTLIRWRSLRVAWGALLISGVAWASGSVKQPSTSPDQPTAGMVGSSSHYLQITISPSTAHIIQGAVYGLDAEIQNASTLPITIDFNELELTVQPELAPPNVSCTWFYDAVVNTKVPAPLVMQPGDHFTVFFDTGSAADINALHNAPQCKASSWERVRRQLDFVPGNYSFVMTGTFTTPALTNSTSDTSSKTPNATSDGSAKPDKHYFTETAILPVTIDQSQIILYAGVGGLLAFLVTSFRSAGTLWEYAGQGQKGSRPDSRLKRTLFILRSVAAAILVSVAVTVIAGRLSTTSFPIKVSVEDFWGALTVGFVSYFIGGKFIDKLSDTLTPGGPLSPTLTPPPTSTPAVTTTPAADASTTPAVDTTPQEAETTPVVTASPAASTTPAEATTTPAVDTIPQESETTPTATAIPTADTTPAVDTTPQAADATPAATTIPTADATPAPAVTGTTPAELEKEEKP